MKPEDTENYVKFTWEDNHFHNGSKEGISVVTDTYLSIHSPKGNWFKNMLNEALKQQNEMLNKIKNS